MARPKKTAAASHTNRISIRVTDDELEQIDRKAQKAGLSRSEFVRQAATSKKITVKQTRQADRGLIFQLMKIGTNLNQIVHASHIKGELPDSFPVICAEIERLVVKAAEEVDAE